MRREENVDDWAEVVFRHAHMVYRKEPFCIPTMLNDIKEAGEENGINERKNIGYYQGEIIRYLESKDIIEEVENDNRSDLLFKLTPHAFVVAKYGSIRDYETTTVMNERKQKVQQDLAIDLSQNQINTNKTIALFTFWVMVGGLAAANYYVLEIIRIYILSQSPSKENVLCVIAIILIVASTVLVYFLWRKLNNREK
jgi:DUF438 domain-containing protein